MVVALCCWLFGYVLFVGRCVLGFDCGLLFVVVCSLCAGVVDVRCRVLFLACCVLCVVCCVLFVVVWLLLSVVWLLLNVV